MLTVKKTIILQNERGLLFKRGRYVRLLNAGVYRTFSKDIIDKHNIAYEIKPNYCSLNLLLNDPEFKKDVTEITIGDEQLGLHFIDGNFVSLVNPGHHAYWNANGEHSFIVTDFSNPLIAPDIPSFIFKKIPASTFIKFEVAEYQKGLLFLANRFDKILDAGTYYFWKNTVDVTVKIIDTRLIQMAISGQEILTQDKIALRINFICNYRVTDYVKIITEIDDYQEQIHVAVQLALRDYIGQYRLDEILDNKDKISEYVFEKLRAKESEFYIKVFDVGVKDIIIPGEIRDIMNTVLIAEKKAQANVIARREEVASTRSLLNTARLMEENQTLYKLKELEYLERICEHVGSINVTGSQDVLSQLAGILKSK